MNKWHNIMRMVCISLVGALVLAFSAPSTAFAARRDCSVETDTGKRMKCKAQNLNDAFGGLMTTVLNDDTGAFSEKQKKQLDNLKKRSKNAIDRTPPEDFKQLAKKRKVECYTQEILGDIEENDDLNDNGECDADETCIGNEDGICDPNERNKGGCAEVLDDGIGDDDGVCELKGKYKEACIEICDPDVIMQEGDETNVDQGRAEEIEQALVDTTDIVEDANVRLTAFISARGAAALAYMDCDKGTMTSCEYLQCIIDDGRSASSATIEDLAITAAALQAGVEFCRDLGDQTFPVPFIGGSIDVRIACLPLGLGANGVQIISDMIEVVDDSETADRVDATALCATELGDDIQELDALTRTAIKLLLQARGRRPGFPKK